MSTVTVSRNTAQGLPPGLRSAQTAIRLPEVQEMLRRLSGHGLGIFMPHMHDTQTGDFVSLPDDVTQVEAGLEVSFLPAAEVASRADRFLPVAWLWRAGAVTTAAACEMVEPESPEDDESPVKHKMPARS
ncbi:MAG: hypothetical protein ABI831_25830 [Betaproteobacteria bacterium]